MTKSELIAEISNRTGQTKADVEKTMKSFEDIAHEVVAKGEEKLTLPGFISFEQTHRKARTARNPQTGAAIQVPATNAAKVSAGASSRHQPRLAPESSATQEVERRSARALLLSRFATTQFLVQCDARPLVSTHGNNTTRCRCKSAGVHPR